MPTFRFPLEEVLSHRRRLEEQKQRDLAVLQQEMKQAQDVLRDMNQTVQSSVGDLRENHLIGRLDLAFLAAHRRYMLAAQRRGTLMAQKMALLQRQIEEAQKALLEAAKQRKMIEKLRERQRQRWAGEISRKEAVELDEVATRIGALSDELEWRT